MLDHCQTETTTHAQKVAICNPQTGENPANAWNPEHCAHDTQDSSAAQKKRAARKAANGPHASFRNKKKTQMAPKLC
jgi:hypothetical protein